jgi:hypothetical protein
VVVIVVLAVVVVDIVDVVIIVSQRTPSKSCWQVQLKPRGRAWLRWQSTAMHCGILGALLNKPTLIGASKKKKKKKN